MAEDTPRMAGDTPEAPPAGGPSEAYFSNSAVLAPIPLRTPAPETRPEPYIRCVNPRLPPKPRQQLIEELPDRDDIAPGQLGLDEDSRGSLGTTWQLLALGPQNYVLDLNPQTTFFRHVYRRHTDFAVECYEDSFDFKLGGTTVVDLPRRGDMLGDVFLEITLPDLGIPGGAWADGIGYVLLTRVRFVVDDLVVHDQERLWYDITDRLFMPHGRLAGIDVMIGRGRTLATDRAHTVLVPLKLLCCKAHYRNQQFLPIGGLATKTKLTLELGAETLANCLVLPDNTPAPLLTKLAAKVLSDQVFLEQDEQRAVMQRATTMLVETAQDVDALTYQFDDNGTYDLAAAQLDLRELNLPVKLLAFVAYDENDTTKATYFRYLNVIDGAVLLINSSERFAPRRGEYFGLVQTYQHCGRCTTDLVHAYSFALDATERQPSGALNFAVLDRPALRVELKNTAGRAVKIKCFAYCYNWLTVDSGALSFRFT